MKSSKYLYLLNSVEEKCYGPGSPIGSKGRVLLYLRHRVLRHSDLQPQIPKSDIMKATGLSKRVVERSLLSLEKTKHILILRTKVGKICQENSYELHPDRYGPGLKASFSEEY